MEADAARQREQKSQGAGVVASSCGYVDSSKIGEDQEKEEPPIQIKVLFFARARELSGLTEMSFEMPPGSTASHCVNKIRTKFPRLEEILNSVVLAVNEEYADGSTILRNRDELAIIPPISGG